MFLTAPETRGESRNAARILRLGLEAACCRSARLPSRSSISAILPMGFPLPTVAVISRFLAKVALESMTARLSEHPEGLDYLCDEAQLDLLRNEAAASD